MEDWVVANCANWNDRVPIHARPAFYDVEGWLAEWPGPRSWEREVLGDVAGLDIVYLQCHLGVLGKHPDYIRLVDELGARRFSIPDAVWDAMSPAERWAANQAVLDQAIADGIPIVLSNPATPEFLTGTFGDEIAYLIKQGYEIGPDALSMVPGGG